MTGGEIRLGAAETRSRSGWAIGILVVIVVLVGVDLATDAWAGSRWLHFGLELLVAVLSAAGAVVLWARMLSARRAAAGLKRDLAALRTDADRWRREAEDALRGLGAAIDRQFDHWKLSIAEREIGLLLLKGLSLKDIADARQTSERTVRQQALGIYRKAGLAGRAELSAFFLEDLLLPSKPASS